MDFLQVLWTDDTATLTAIKLVLGFASATAVFVFLPIEVRLLRLWRVRRRLKAAASRNTTPESQRDAVDAVMKRSSLVKTWTLFKHRWDDERAAVGKDRAPVRLADVLAERPALALGVRRSLLPTLPGLFVAIGLLGTFYGLTLAANEAGQASQAQVKVNTEAPRVPAKAPTASGDQQIRSLMRYMGLAFRTSLYGLSFSLLFALIVRQIEGGYESTEQELDTLVTDVFGWLSPDEVAARGIQSQSTLMDSLRSEMTTMISEFGDLMEGGLEKIAETTASAASLISNEQREALGQIVRDLNEQVQAAVGTHLESLGAALQQTIQGQETIASSLNNTFERIEAATSSQALLLERLDSASSAVDGAAQSIRSATEELRPAAVSLADTGAALERTAEAIQGTQEAAHGAVEAVSESLRQARESLEQQRSLVESSLGEIQTSLESLNRGLADDLSGALHSVDDLLDRAFQRLSGTVLETNQTLDRLTTPVGELLTGTHDMQQNLVELGSNLGALLELSATLSESTQASQEVRVAIEATGRQLTESIEPLTNNITRMSDSNREVQDAVQDAGQRMSESVASLPPALEDAAKKSESLRLGIDDMKTRITASVNEIRSALLDTAGPQQSAMVDLTKELKTLTTSTEALKKQLSSPPQPARPAPSSPAASIPRIQTPAVPVPEQPARPAPPPAGTRSPAASRTEETRSQAEISSISVDQTPSIPERERQPKRRSLFSRLTGRG